jgi:predicted transcriptional regulator
MAKPLIRTDIHLSDFTRDKLKELARGQDVSSAELTRRILDKHIKRELKKQSKSHARS